MDPTEKALPPEALLIRRARQAQGLSPEKIVERLTRIKMSSRNWRLIEDGRGAPDDTIAHMAAVAGVAPEDLAESRPEAAAILREIRRQASELQEEPTRAELIRRAEALMAEANEYLRRARGETG